MCSVKMFGAIGVRCKWTVSEVAVTLGCASRLARVRVTAAAARHLRCRGRPRVASIGGAPSWTRSRDAGGRGGGGGRCRWRRPRRRRPGATPPLMTPQGTTAWTVAGDVAELRRRHPPACAGSGLGLPPLVRPRPPVVPPPWTRQGGGVCGRRLRGPAARRRGRCCAALRRQNRVPGRGRGDAGVPLTPCFCGAVAVDGGEPRDAGRATPGSTLSCPRRAAALEEVVGAGVRLTPCMGWRDASCRPPLWTIPRCVDGVAGRGGGQPLLAWLPL